MEKKTASGHSEVHYIFMSPC